MPKQRRTEKTDLQNEVELGIATLVATLQKFEKARVIQGEAEGFAEMHYYLEIAVPLSDKKIKANDKTSKGYGL